MAELSSWLERLPESAYAIGTASSKTKIAYFNSIFSLLPRNRRCIVRSGMIFKHSAERVERCTGMVPIPRLFLHQIRERDEVAVSLLGFLDYPFVRQRCYPP